MFQKKDYKTLPEEGNREIIATLSTPVRVALSQTVCKFSIMLLTLKLCSCWCCDVVWSMSSIRSSLLLMLTVVVGCCWSLFAKKDRLECVVISVDSSQILKTPSIQWVRTYKRLFYIHYLDMYTLNKSQRNLFFSIFWKEKKDWMHSFQLRRNKKSE